MINKILLTFLIMEALFLLGGGLLIAFPLITMSQMNEAPTTSTAARNLLLRRCPMNAAIANAILVFVTFLTSIPAVMTPARSWLKIHGYLVTICGLFSLVIGLNLWFDTLKTRSHLSDVWASQSSAVQSLLQQQLKCCGYLNSNSPPFVTDTTCTNALQAAQLSGCVGPFSSFANDFLDMVFTAAFGVVGLDLALMLSTVMLLKDRKERARYRHIDEKNGMQGF